MGRELTLHVTLLDGKETAAALGGDGDMPWWRLVVWNLFVGCSLVLYPVWHLPAASHDAGILLPARFPSNRFNAVNRRIKDKSSNTWVAAWK